jgi:hypothetical protein
MSEEVRAAVFGNVGTMIAFRVGSFDAEVLEKEFAPKFTAEDIVNLGFAQVYLRLMIDGIGSQPFSATTLPPIPEPAVSFREQVVSHSRASYGQLRSIVEEQVKLQTIGEDKPAPASYQPSQTRDSRPQPQAQNNNQPRPAYQQNSYQPDRRQENNRPIERQPERRDERRDDRRDAPREMRDDRRPNPMPIPPKPKPAPPPDETGGFLNITSLKSAQKIPQPKYEQKHVEPEEQKQRQQNPVLPEQRKEAPAPQPKQDTRGQVREVPEDVLKKVLDL